MSHPKRNMLIELFNVVHSFVSLEPKPLEGVLFDCFVNQLLTGRNSTADRCLDGARTFASWNTIIQSSLRIIIVVGHEMREYREWWRSMSRLEWKTAKKRTEFWLRSPWSDEIKPKCLPCLSGWVWKQPLCQLTLQGWVKAVKRLQAAWLFCECEIRLRKERTSWRAHQCWDQGKVRQSALEDETLGYHVSAWHLPSVGTMPRQPQANDRAQRALGGETSMWGAWCASKKVAS